MQRVWSTYLESNSSHGHNVDNDALRRPTIQQMEYTPHRRASSNMSHTNSLASSQRHILADNDPNMLLEPPNAPFAGMGASLPSPKGSFQSLSNLPVSDSAKGTTTSLSVNFLPSKFSRPVSPGMHKRKNAKGGMIPKQGGGREAFRSGEARMPGENDDDYDGVDVSNVRATWFGGGGRKPKLRWNKFKWILFLMNILVSIYSLTALIFCLLTWFNVWSHADVVRVGNRTELIVSTLASCTGIITSLLGWAGILLNNRGFLAVYTVLLWVMFAMIAAPGYLTYKRRTFNLEGKVNSQWSRSLGIEGRLRIQNQLLCCGYFSPFVEATVSQTCYSRSLLPGCKAGYLKFERKVLERWYAVAFSLVPVHIAAIIAALLCSNHVTYRFGKGMMPKAYRLSMNSMAVIMDNYANQLAEQYGTDVASELMARSRSNLQLDSIPSLAYGQSSNTPPPPSFSSSQQHEGGAYHGQYSSLSGAIASDEDGKRM